MAADDSEEEPDAPPTTANDADDPPPPEGSEDPPPPPAPEADGATADAADADAAAAAAAVAAAAATAATPAPAPAATEGGDDDGEEEDEEEGEDGEEDEEEEGGAGGNPMLTSFTVRETGTTAQAVFVPDGYRLTPQRMTQLISSKQWNLPPPNTMISCDGGTVHPKLFATELLAKLPTFASTWDEARLHATTARPGWAGCADEAEISEFGLKVINNVIYLKLITIFCSLLEAAATAGWWILVDRTSSKSPAADLLIEAAMAATANPPPVVVIDSLQRLRNFTGEKGDGDIGAETQKCLDDLERMKAPKNCQPLGSDDPVGNTAIHQFYDPEEFQEFANYYDLPLPRPPEAAHTRGRPDGSVPERVRWQYHYLQTFFRSGSHYIILDNARDAPDLTPLGPFGYIALNGQEMMLERLKARIQAGSSIVMLHNTGGVVQAFASLRKAMLSFPPPEADELLDKIELVSTAYWARTFGLPEILMLKELHERAPMLMRTSCVAVDVMKDNSEEVLSTFTCCFAATGGGMPELGIGQAETLCVLTCWKRHITLLDNARKYEKIADFMQILLYVLGIVTTVIAVMYTKEDPASAAVAAAMADSFLAGDATGAADAGAAAAAGAPTPGSTVGEILSDLMDATSARGAPRVAWLATAASPESLAPATRLAGRLDFDGEIRAPERAGGREALVAAVADARGTPVAPGAARAAAKRAEGFAAGDLRAYVERAAHAAAAERLRGGSAESAESSGSGSGSGSGAASLRARDFEEARSGLTSTATRALGARARGGVDGNSSPGSASLDAVGGLAEVKAALDEALSLPSRHASLFADAPLRLRTGALLYGPPGCGKTMVALAAVAAAGLRCVSVKGPELLNKYIGQSEAGVRDVFRRAAAAAPCALFFDEFDAIAPRRGHDSTGVTDRVVNQFLTELDGVEGLAGVTVLAATSRPDLIDPALLRPGRLDRLLLCPFPNRRDRRDVLRVAAGIPTGAEGDARARETGVDDVADGAEGFSGADLRAVVADANLFAIHRAMEEEKKRAEEDGDAEKDGDASGAGRGASHSDPRPTREDYARAAASARASVPARERARLEAVYASFHGGRAEARGAGSERGGKRVSHA